MAATRALVGKELAEHGAALGGVTVLLATAWGLGWVVQSRAARVLSPLELLPTFATGALVAAALFLGHRLLVVEHFGRTQRFVEALPIRRGHMALVKGLFGLGWLEVWAAGALAATAAAAGPSEAITGRFAAILAARLGLFVFAMWGVVFLLGFFGRLRIPLGGLLVAAALLLDRYTPLEIARFGPLQLVAHDSFAFERQHFPIAALAQAAAVGAGAMALAWAMAWTREGALVESLARRLSPRELGALLVIAGGAATVFMALGKEAAPPPYALTTNKVVRAADGRVEVAYFEDPLRPAAVRLADQVVPVLHAFADALQLPWPLPPVRLVHGTEIAPDRPRTVRNHRQEGLVLRVNLTDGSARARTQILMTVVHQLIAARTGGRAGLEPKHWMLDGFSLYLASGGSRAAGGAPIGADDESLAALVGDALVPLGAAALRDYLTTAERIGDDLAGALACSGWRVLEARAGRERALALARAAFTRPGTGDVRDFIAERRDAMPALFQRATGMAWDDFLAAWAAELARARAQPAAAALLRALPRTDGARALRADAATGVGVDARFEPPPPVETDCALRHLRLPAYDTALAAEELEESAVVWPAGQARLRHAVTGTYGRGERVFVALDCRLAGLGGAEVRLLAGRVTVR